MTSTVTFHLVNKKYEIPTIWRSLKNTLKNYLLEKKYNFESLKNKYNFENFEKRENIIDQRDASYMYIPPSFLTPSTLILHEVIQLVKK